MSQHHRFVIIQTLNCADALCSIVGKQLCFEKSARSNTRNEVDCHIPPS